VITVIAVLWGILNAGNSDVPDHDLANAPSLSWSQIIHGWIRDFEAVLALVTLVVIVCFVYGWWHDRNRQAAESRRLADDPDAAHTQYILGLRYSQGLDLPEDQRKAAACFRRAAEQGHTDAQLALGLFHQNGQGVPQSYAESYYWLLLALGGATEPNKLSYIKLRDDAASRLTVTEQFTAHTKAAKWLAEHRAYSSRQAISKERHGNADRV
jgi:Sel1 repeat